MESRNHRGISSVSPLDVTVALYVLESTKVTSIFSSTPAIPIRLVMSIPPANMPVITYVLPSKLFFEPPANALVSDKVQKIAAVSRLATLPVIFLLKFMDSPLSFYSPEFYIKNRWCQ